jgi:hypothetical protein
MRAWGYLSVDFDRARTQGVLRNEVHWNVHVGERVFYSNAVLDILAMRDFLPHLVMGLVGSVLEPWKAP